MPGDTPPHGPPEGEGQDDPRTENLLVPVHHQQHVCIPSLTHLLGAAVQAGDQSDRSEQHCDSRIQRARHPHRPGGGSPSRTNRDVHLPTELRLSFPLLHLAVPVLGRTESVRNSPYGRLESSRLKFPSVETETEF